MAQPMFSALGGMSPDELLKRLGVAIDPVANRPDELDPNAPAPQWAGPVEAIGGNWQGGQKPRFGSVMDSLSPDELSSRLAGVGMAAGSKQTLPTKSQPLSPPPPPAPPGEDDVIGMTSSPPPSQIGTPQSAPPVMSSDTVLSRLGGSIPKPQPGAPPSFMSAPQDAFDNAPGSSKMLAPPSQGSPGGAAGGQFAPFSLPPSPAYEPTYVPNAIRTGMYNPGGSTPWDRGQTANSREEELQLRQQAGYNHVLDLIRPGGLGMPGTTGPIIGLQPHEIAALTALGGQQANNLFQGRKLAEDSSGQDRAQLLDALKANATNQTHLQAADITGKAHVAGAQAAHNPDAVKAQFAAQYLAQGGSPQLLGGMLHSLEGSLRKSSPGAAGATGGAPRGSGPSPQDEIGAAGSLNSLAAMMGKGPPGHGFQLENFNPDQAGKVMDFVAGLKSPGEQEAVLRELISGRLGNQQQIRDNILRSGASANYQIQPPIDQRTGKAVDWDTMGSQPPPYAIHGDDGSELYRYTHNPNGTWVNEALQRTIGNTGYNQLQLPNGAGSVDIDRSLLTPSVFANKLPRQTLESRAKISQQMLRMLMQQNQPQQK